ncbi:hypothetical protein LTR78_005842 [Recurvomyces mirabilis]|uniref:Heterokaryon incompatibility domain-containing protein n=1 Tax=Recurvomyces mirabilis TaxID=574656 RepID=A0AAE0WMG4_9PEZI|nr:hypothetical protein LTR78_005842 [Recurvomyces mirabilis]
MYEALPSGRFTLAATPLQPERLVLRMRTVDLDKVTPSSRDAKALDSEQTDEDDDDDNDGEGFDALSYTWGAPWSTPEYESQYGPENDVDIIVLVHGDMRHKQRIGRNLYEALCRIKASESSPKWLWVDAVCINQQDPSEKGKHVLLMSDIYTKAMRVIVWFGQGNVDDYKHLAWLHSHALDVIEDYVEDNMPLQRSDFSQVAGGEGIVVHCLNEYLLPREALTALYKFYA